MTPHWTNFVITAAEAAAALTGLVIVAISVNITKILSYGHLPARAGATVATLILILVVGLSALIPQGMGALGFETTFFGVCCWLLQLWAARQTLTFWREYHRPWYEAARGVTLGQVQTLPFIIGGIMLSISNASGLYWIAGGAIAVFIFSTFNAWVLLVEILR
jgi:modulator of FtsH protease